MPGQTPDDDPKPSRQETWSKKEFLTPEGEVSTSSVCSFAGKTKWREDLPAFDNYFLEVANCHHKARLHKTEEMTVDEWIMQLTKLRDHVDSYLTFLQMQMSSLSSGIKGR
jgi:hypothetical protein